MKKQALIFCVTGTPGCGKTTFAKALAKRKHLHYVNLHRLLRIRRLYSSYDGRLKSYVYEPAVVRRFLKSLIREAQKKGDGLVLDGHLSHEAPPSLVTCCYVVKCPLLLLRNRLASRGYSLAKIRENLDAEILDVCLQEALEAGHNVSIVKR